MEKSNQDYTWILSEYPEIISKDQLCRICHISKKTALFYIERGFIPCVDTGKQTHRYQIKAADVALFLQSRDANPAAYQPPRGFYKPPKTPLGAPRFSAYKQKKLRAAFHTLESVIPDVLSCKEAAAYLGCDPSTVTHWCNGKGLKAFLIQRKYHIPRVALYEFLEANHYEPLTKASCDHILRSVETPPVVPAPPAEQPEPVAQELPAAPAPKRSAPRRVSRRKIVIKRKW